MPSEGTDDTQPATANETVESNEVAENTAVTSEDEDNEESATVQEPEAEPTAVEEEEAEAETTNEDEEEDPGDYPIATTITEAAIIRETDWVKGANDPVFTIIEYGDFQ